MFPSPLLIFSKLFQVSQTFQHACRLDGKYLLSSLLVWSGHPPPISYSRHTKLPKYVLLFWYRVSNTIWGYLSGWMGTIWVSQDPPPILEILTYQLPQEDISCWLGPTCNTLCNTDFLWAFCQPCESVAPFSPCPWILNLAPSPYFHISAGLMDAFCMHLCSILCIYIIK